MEHLENITKPSKEEQKVAMESYNALAGVLERLHKDNPEIEIKEINARFHTHRVSK